MSKESLCGGQLLATIVTMGVICGFSAGVDARAHGEIEVLHRWVQLVPDGDSTAPRALVRVIVGKDSPCPDLDVDDAGEKIAMTERPRPQQVEGQKAPDFSAIKVCEALISQKYTKRFTQVNVNGDRKLALTLPNLSQGVPLGDVVIIGDTGCRNDKSQACDPESWPFKKLSEQAGRVRASSGVPPVVIHLGDYRYSNKGLGDSWGPRKGKKDREKWGGWKQGFFAPVDELLKNGLWVTLRGNHEACGEHGPGYLYFFHPGENRCDTVGPDKDMHGVMPAYALDARSYSGTASHGLWQGDIIRLVFMDAAQRGSSRPVVKDDELDQARAISEHYRDQFNRINDRFVIGDPQKKVIWFFSHMPLFSLNGSEFKSHALIDALLESRLNDNISAVSMAIAGHRHEFELVNAQAGNPARQRPVQYVVGNGGVVLSGKNSSKDGGQKPCENADAVWTSVMDDKQKTESWAVLRRPNFGYLRVDARGGNWRSEYDMVFYSAKDEKWMRDASVSCYSDNTNPGRIFCPWLPKDNSTPVCPGIDFTEYPDYKAGQTDDMRL